MTTRGLAAPGLGAPRARRSRGRRVLAILGIILLLGIIALAGLAVFLLRRPLPVTSGQLRLPGLSAPVSVVRDHAGFPHLTGATSADLFRAQGYVVAQDRLWQMDFFRRVGAGRLSEVLGAATLDVDRFARTIGWRRAAQKELATLPADSRAALQQYADGVNAFLDTQADALPLEFTILGYKPEPWTPLDIVTFGKVQAWSLGENLDVEITMADLQAKLGPARAAALLPAYPDQQPTIALQSALHGQAGGRRPTSLALRALFGSGAGSDPLGSNNWVVDGTRSVDGHPLLANDPHLGVQNPSIWYALQMRAADGSLDVEGVTFPGVPGVIVGHNKDITWGVTNLGPDTEDLFIEHLDPAGHPGQYEFQGAWRSLDVLTETIRVKGADSQDLAVRSTHHGPLLDAVRDDLKQPSALQWAALQTGGVPDAVLRLDRATDWASFHAALAGWAAPGQNFVYADIKGNIGYQATGRWPIRPKSNGLAPVDGASGENDWAGFVPYEQLPRVYNPPEHYIVTANNRVTPPGSAPQATAWWFPWFRAERITQMLGQKQKLSVDDMKAIQLDQHSVLAADIAPHLAALTSSDADTQAAANLFKNWDANIASDSETAAIYETTYQQILTDTFADDLGGNLTEEYFASDATAAAMLLDKIVNDPQNAWWNDVTTPKKETRDDILLKALGEAVAAISAHQGADMSKWTWGAQHEIVFNHTLGAVQPLDLLFNLGPYPAGGDGYTVNVGTFTEASPGSYLYVQTGHPSMRQIMDTGDWTKTQLIFSPGESGQPGSSHWGDQVNDWLHGNYRTPPWSDAQIGSEGEATLTLKP